MATGDRALARGRRAVRSSRGQALAEFALILVVLMLIVLGIVDLSRAVYIRSVVANAAREGARYAIVHPGAGQDEIAERARALIVGFDAEQVAVTMTQPDPDHVQVVVTYTFYPATGLIAHAAGIGPGGLELRGSSIMRLEAR